MWGFLNKWINKDEVKSNTAASLFENDEKVIPKDTFCMYQDKNGNCPREQDNTNVCRVLEEHSFDNNKRSILIVDDNPGMVSFLKDDIEFIEHDNVINLSEYNLLTFDTPYAAFTFQKVQDMNNGLNIDYAILDITIGGSIMTPNGNIKYTGVDIYEMILKYNPDVKVIFYTGNQLNPYIKSNKKLIDQFSTITNGKKINDFILFKTSLDLDDRRKFFSDFFNKGN